MAKSELIAKVRKQGRKIYSTKPGTTSRAALGPLAQLPGRWSNTPNFPGRGWNIIALPFARGPSNYRVLMNQYNEELTFTTVDEGVPNRGIKDFRGGKRQSDQFLVALDYQQTIAQVAAADFPESGEAGGKGLPIHHEPGLWLNMLNETTDDLDIARLATVPHGDAALAMGRSSKHGGPPELPENVSAFPIGVPATVTDRGGNEIPNPYLAPYQHFIDNPFTGIVPPPFPGFLPDDTSALLHAAIDRRDVKRHTVLDVDTTIPTGGIHNIPFIVKQANAASMKSTFWISELAEKDKYGNNRMILQYFQVVMLDFFDRTDGLPGRIGWPHISINTLEKVAGPEEPAGKKKKAAARR